MSKLQRNATDIQEECPYHGDDLDKKGICWTCYELLQEDLQRVENEDAEYERTRHSEAETHALLQRADHIKTTLEWTGLVGLAQILADREQTEALRLLILARDEETLKVLFNCHKGSVFFKPKPGPRMKNGIRLEEQVLRMKREGKTNGQIAKVLKTKKSTVAAAYNNITNKIAKEQIKDRGQ